MSLFPPDDYKVVVIEGYKQGVTFRAKLTGRQKVVFQSEFLSSRDAAIKDLQAQVDADYANRMKAFEVAK